MAIYTARCSCCRREAANTFWTVLTPAGLTDHICRACGPHIDLQSSGEIQYPDVCPLAVRQAGLRLV